MKTLFLFLSPFLTVISCAGIPGRAPATAAATDCELKGAEVGVKQKLFQGPFLVDPQGFNRPSKVYLPNNLADCGKWPLILMLHGFTSDAEVTDEYIFGLSKRVTTRGFILLEPEGTRMQNDDPTPAAFYKKGDRFWNATDYCCDFEKTGTDDVAYLMALIQAAVVKYKGKVDLDRIYLFGHSNGGFMVNRLLCESDGFFAGAAVLAGGTFKDPQKCRLVNPVSYLQAHSIEDPTVSYDQKTPDQGYAGGYETVMRRVSAAGCTGPGEVGEQVNYVASIYGGDTTPTTWKSCLLGTEVELWTIGKGAKTDFLNKPHHPLFWNIAGEEAINFLFRHTRPHN